MKQEPIDTHSKALRINLDPRWYGTFAEIGAGQEVVRWFFRVGGAAGTVAKSMTGCNVGAKNTVYMNYLPLAKLGGAHIFTQTTVHNVEKSNEGWAVNVTHHKNRFTSENATLTARNVVLAAGTLGSTEILLRSQAKGLSLAPGIGSRFGGNGDFFGAAYNSNQITNDVG